MRVPAVGRGDDAERLSQAGLEARLVHTRDRELAARAAGAAVLIRKARAEPQASELARFDLDWRAAVQPLPDGQPAASARDIRGDRAHAADLPNAARAVPRLALLRPPVLAGQPCPTLGHA